MFSRAAQQVVHGLLFMERRPEIHLQVTCGFSRANMRLPQLSSLTSGMNDPEFFAIGPTRYYGLALRKGIFT